MVLTPEAVVESLGFRHNERGHFLSVEWAKAHVFVSAPGEADPTFDDINYGQASPEIVERNLPAGLINSSRQLLKGLAYIFGFKRIVAEFPPVLMLSPVKDRCQRISRAGNRVFEYVALDVVDR